MPNTTVTTITTATPAAIRRHRLAYVPPTKTVASGVTFTPAVR